MCDRKHQTQLMGQYAPKLRTVDNNVSSDNTTRIVKYIPDK